MDNKLKPIVNEALEMVKKIEESLFEMKKGLSDYLGKEGKLINMFPGEKENDKKKEQ